MARQERIRPGCGDFVRQRGDWRVVMVAVNEPHAVSGVQKRPANGQKAQRRQMLAREPAANGRVGDVD